MNCPICSTNNIALHPSKPPYQQIVIPSKAKIYQCPNCKTHFYSVEPNKVYLIKRPSFACKFCNNFCGNIKWTGSDTHEHWACQNCMTEYKLRNSQPPIEVIDLYTRLNEHVYFISLITHQQKTEIYKMLPITDDDQFYPELISKIDALADVNPSNVNNKLKTYLIFS